MPVPTACAETRALAPCPTYFSPAAQGLMRLGPGHCRWPIGDLADHDFTFCGTPQAARSRYCAAHRALAVLR